VTNGNFELHLAVSPNSAAPMGPMSASVTGSGIEWWAEDDLENSYLGAIGKWGGGADIAEGTVIYWPALDPQATRLRIMPTGSHERAVNPGGITWRCIEESPRPSLDHAEYASSKCLAVSLATGIAPKRGPIRFSTLRLASSRVLGA
jgi:hypothetical protein